MRFALDEDREALRLAARDILAQLCSPATVREAWEGEPSSAPWQALADVGALTVLIPESRGGLGLDETYLIPVIEEAGRAALPHPLSETALVAAPLGVAGLMVATNLGSAVGDDTSALTGAVVPAATYAEAFLLLAASDRMELRLFDADDVAVEAIATVDRSRHCGRVAASGDGTLITDDPAEVAAAFDRGVLGAAAELVGLAEAMLAMTVDYVCQRHQFGKPIGSFQAVKHHLANARLQLEFAVPALRYAAYATAHSVQPGDDTEVRRSVSQAKYLAGAAASVTGRAAMQCHGAIGYTTEYDLHLYLKRSWALARSWGDASFHADRVADCLGL